MDERSLWKSGSIDYDKTGELSRIVCGGILIDQGIHMLDLMMFFSKSKLNKNSVLTTAF